MQRWVLPAAFTITAAAGAQALPTGKPLPPNPIDPAIAAAVKNISAENVKADITRLVSFGTRSTLSSMNTDMPAGQGIAAAADWIASEFESISKQCGGCLEVKRDEFVEQGSDAPLSRIKKPT